MTTSDYIALLGGIASVFAALAAWRSAEIAKQATQQAARQQRETLVRQTSAAAQSVVTRANRVIQLAASVRVAYEQLITLSHRSLVAADSEVLAKSAQHGTRAQKICDAGNAVLSSELESKSDAELARTLTSLEVFLVELDGLKEAVSTELNGYEKESQIRRETNARMQAAALGAKLQPGNPRP